MKPQAALLAILLLGAACPEPAEDAALPRIPREAYVLAEQNVWQSPDANSAVLARLPAGSSLIVGSCGSAWCGIATAEVTGYVPEANLSDTISTNAYSGQGQQRPGRGYTNSQGEWVPSPTFTPDGQPPAGASARCRDGSYSFSRSRRGTCSWHGGVARWLQ